jgi:sec-independent protein translocase protein TatB
VGLSFGEIVVLAFLALMVVGPKDLPKMLRSAGRFLGQARRAIDDVRKETGLDDVLRGDLRDLERLADHIERLEPYKGDGAPVEPVRPKIDWASLRLREYPAIAADGGALMPEDSVAYSDLPMHAPPPALEAPKAEASAPSTNEPAKEAASAPVAPVEAAT